MIWKKRPKAGHPGIWAKGLRLLVGLELIRQCPTVSGKMESDKIPKSESKTSGSEGFEKCLGYFIMFLFASVGLLSRRCAIITIVVRQYIMWCRANAICNFGVLVMSLLLLPRNFQAQTMGATIGGSMEKWDGASSLLRLQMIPAIR